MTFQLGSGQLKDVFCQVHGHSCSIHVRLLRSGGSPSHHSSGNARNARALNATLGKKMSTANWFEFDPEEPLPEKAREQQRWAP